MKLKSLFTLSAIIAMIALGAYTFPEKQEEHRAKNLKILPADISHEALDSIMRSYKDALGVKCNFCHAQSKETGRMDFASDDNKHKLISRKMMLMTDSINQKYFSRHLARHGVAAIKCATCHRGKAEPSLEAATAQ